MSKLIVSIGGTGQMVLHYFYQLYLLGLLDLDNFYSLVIDTDRINGGIQRIKKFMEDLQFGQTENQAYGKQVPLIDTLKIDIAEKDDVLNILTNRAEIDESRPLFPAQAYFSDNSLRQKVGSGLYYRPCLSTLIAGDWLRDRNLPIENRSIVVIVASIIGGTGSGLIGPVVDELNRIAAAKNWSLRFRLVLFGNYFSTDEVEIGSRFQSNQVFVLKSLEEIMKGNVQLFHIVGGLNVNANMKRNPDHEKKGSYIPWPQEGEPFWQGVRALIHFLSAELRDMPNEFAEKEITEIPSETLNWEAANLRRSRITQFVTTMVKKKLFQRMGRENYFNHIWGDNPKQMLSQFWTIYKMTERGPKALNAFTGSAQARLQALWQGEGDVMGFREIFPQLSGNDEKLTFRPGDIATHQWPIEPGQHDKRLFQEKDITASKLAANWLYWAMRGGR